jgi:hypothetical protein
MVSNYDNLRKDQLKENLRNISFQIVNISQQLAQSGTVLEKRKFRKPGNYTEISQNLKKADDLEQANQVPERDANLPKFASKTMPTPQTESMDEYTQIEIEKGVESDEIKSEPVERVHEYEIDEEHPRFQYSEEPKIATWEDTSSLEDNETVEEVAKKDIISETNQEEIKEAEVSEIYQVKEIVKEADLDAEIIEGDQLKEEFVQESEVNGWGDDIPDEFNQSLDEQVQDYDRGQHMLEEEGQEPEVSGWGEDIPDDFNQIPDEKPEDITTSITTEHISKEEPEYFNKSLTAEHNLKEGAEEITGKDKIEQPTEFKEEIYRLEQEEIQEPRGWADDIIEPNITEQIISASNTEEVSKVLEQTKLLPESEPAEDQQPPIEDIIQSTNQDIQTPSDHAINIQPKDVTSILDESDIQQFTPYFKSPQSSELFTWGHESTPSVPISSPPQSQSQPESFKPYEDLPKATLSLPETSQRDSIASDFTSNLSTSTYSKIPKISSQDELMDLKDSLSKDCQELTESQSFPDIYSIETSLPPLQIPEPVKKPLNIPRKKPIPRKQGRPTAAFSLRSRTAGEDDDLENILGTTAPSMTELEANLKKYRQ